MTGAHDNGTIAGTVRRASARAETRPLVAGAGALAVVLAAVALVGAGVLGDRWGAGGAVLVTSALAGVGAHSAMRASHRSAGVERRVWRLMAYGLLSWALGVVPYLAFLAADGDLRSPNAVSQVGFLLAYPFWYRALWLVREPAVGHSARQRAETWATEAVILALVGAIAAAALWNGGISAADNIAQMLPLGLDLLLLHAVYSAVRRSSVTHRTAFVWLAYGFGALAVTDAAVTRLVMSAPVPVLGVALLGYAAAMCLIAIAATRPLRMSEARTMLERSDALLIAFGLGLSAAAGTVMPPGARPLAWAVGGLLFARLWVVLGRRGRTETDPLTGFLEARAFTRHVAGVAQISDTERPAALIAVELAGFDEWAAHHSTGARDTALGAVAARLDASPLERGVWGRIGADRMAWVGRVLDVEQARALAEAARSAAADAASGVDGRAAFAMLPADAPQGADAVAAALEALAAGRAAGRSVVAFDRGHLDGIAHAGGYTDSIEQRRQAVLDIFRTRDAVETLLQPIVSLETGEVTGFEALTRINLIPGRGPDRWIAEAHVVGLGGELEVACVRQAMRRRAELPAGTAMSVNISPDAVLLPELEDAFGAGRLDGLIIEITEHEAVSDYGHLETRLASFRARGARVAIDDAGAGHSSMRHIVRLAPDFIKIDRSLIQDLHLDRAKRALVRSLVGLERDLGTRIVAEGIEHPGELRALRELGVHLGQGYLLGRPIGAPVFGHLAEIWPQLIVDRG